MLNAPGETIPYEDRLRQIREGIVASHDKHAGEFAGRMDHARTSEEPDGRMGANRIGAVTEIGYGVEIWTCDDGRRNRHEEPLGGIVVDIDPGRPDTVSEDGEIVEHPARYRTYDPMAPFPHKAFVWIAEPEINREAVGPAAHYDIVKAVYRFCWQVGKGVEARRGGRRRPSTVLDELDARLIEYSNRLAGVLMGRG